MISKVAVSCFTFGSSSFPTSWFILCCPHPKVILCMSFWTLKVCATAFLADDTNVAASKMTFTHSCMHGDLACCMGNIFFYVTAAMCCSSQVSGTPHSKTYKTPSCVTPSMRDPLHVWTPFMCGPSCVTPLMCAWTACKGERLYPT